jgi:hypothetical protein
MRALFVLALFTGLLLGGGLTSTVAPARAAGTVEVTSDGDEGGAGGAVCPHATLCTLRRAMELANADPGTDAFTITFAPSTSTTAIQVGNSPLPNLVRANVSIDGAGAHLLIENASSSLTAITNGLTVTGDAVALRNLSVSGFRGACIAITGANAVLGTPGAGNTLGGCGSGVAVGGANAVVRANVIGFTSEGAPNPVETGIVLAAADGQVGGPASIEGAGNTIGNATTGIFAGSGGAQAFSGNEIERNLFGRAPDGSAAPVTHAIVLSQPSNQTTILSNTIANAGDGIIVAADVDGVPVVRNRFSGNIFDGISGRAIDLNADGVMNANDSGDSDTGPNGMLNHPSITRATQPRLSGTTCAGCQVQIYVAVHEPGGAHDYGLAPLPGGLLTADGNGQFALDNPPASPGDWLIALATDADGNTSEFGPSARVGAGSVLCGNVQLRAGWNHIGYFGAEPVPLLSTFTPVPSGVVTAVYHFVDGTGAFDRWFSTTAAGRTLTSVEPGESYWIFAEAPATLPGGFSLSFPLPMQLKAGWNDFVYLGATATAADALGSLGGAFESLYRYDAATGGWLRYGDNAVPAWARDFDQLEACGVYQLHLDGPATLLPLQP